MRGITEERAYMEPPQRCRKCWRELGKHGCERCSVESIVLSTPRDMPLRAVSCVLQTWERSR